MTFASLRLMRKRPFIFCVPGKSWLQAIGSEVAAETSRSAEMKAPANTVADWRAEVREAIIGNPLDCLGDPTIGPRNHQCMGRANWILSLFFSGDRERMAKIASAFHRLLGNFPNQLAVVLPPSGCRTCPAM